MSKEEIPPWLREQLARFDQIQQSLQSIMIQKQQVDAEAMDLDKAVVELNKVKNDETVYKSAGPLLVRVKRAEVLKELQEKKELSKTRSLVLSKQESRLKDNAKDLQAKLNESMKGKPSGPKT